MIIRLLARRPHATKSLHTVSATCSSTPISASTLASTSFVRRKHTVPSLKNHDELMQNGIPGLLTPQGFNIAYTGYMEHMASQLNAATAGTEHEHKTPKDIIIDLARSPVHAHTFNVASMAFNNHFFFDGINVEPNTTSVPAPELLEPINDSFSSLDTLRETFLTTAEAMFGPGFVWLVQTNERTGTNPFRILPTYIAGSPLSRAHYRRQSLDLNTENPDSFTAKGLNTVGAFGSSSGQENRQQPKKALGGVDIVPLLCVNTWEHVWLHDYGIKGKRKYLNSWWKTIDWNKVRGYATITPRQTNQFHAGEGTSRRYRATF